LPNYRVKENGMKILKENESGITNIRGFVADSDAVSSYPSNILAINVSKDTTHKEVRSIGNIPKELFKMQNINFLLGKVNALEYATEMFKFPTMFELNERVKKIITSK